MATLTLLTPGTINLGIDAPGFFTDGRLSGGDNIDTPTNSLNYIIETATTPSVYTYSGLLSGDLKITHSIGTLEITGANTYFGGTSIASGTLILDTNTSAGTGTVELFTGTSLLFNADMVGAQAFAHTYP
jgi:autotransporter-associated beta strand protein